MNLPTPASISVNVNVPSSLTAHIDQHLMQRALSNLILNAVQAMPNRGTLTISATTDDGSVAIRVTDTGVGIPADTGNKVLSPLTTGKAKGTGLGLAVVKRIVEAHNGTIAFKSEEGNGTTFTVTLPQTAESSFIHLKSVFPIPHVDVIHVLRQRMLIMRPVDPAHAVLFKTVQRCRRAADLSAGAVLVRDGTVTDRGKKKEKVAPKRSLTSTTTAEGRSQ